jgi:hypothetical protein
VLPRATSWEFAHLAALQRDVLLPGHCRCVTGLSACCGAGPARRSTGAPHNSRLGRPLHDFALRCSSTCWLAALASIAAHFVATERYSRIGGLVQLIPTEPARMRRELVRLADIARPYTGAETEVGLVGALDVGEYRRRDEVTCCLRAVRELCARQTKRVLRGDDQDGFPSELSRYTRRQTTRVPRRCESASVRPGRSALVPVTFSVKMWESETPSFLRASSTRE